MLFSVQQAANPAQATFGACAGATVFFDKRLCGFSAFFIDA
jgi:hypothetical protein